MKTSSEGRAPLCSHQVLNLRHVNGQKDNITIFLNTNHNINCNLCSQFSSPVEYSKAELRIAYEFLQVRGENNR